MDIPNPEKPTSKSKSYPYYFTVATTFMILNGKGSGSADNWTVTGTVTDIKGVASVTAFNSTYGSLTFIVNFVRDPVTHVMTGNGKGERTESLPVIGEVKVDFIYSVSRQA